MRVLIPAGSTGKTVVKRVNPDFLTVLRSSLQEALAPRLEVVEEPDEARKYRDANFVHFVGLKLEKVPDSALISIALLHLIEHVKDRDGSRHLAGRPRGACGIPQIDSITPGHDFDVMPPDVE